MENRSGVIQESKETGDGEQPVWLELQLPVVDGCPGHLALQQEHSFACPGIEEPGQDEGSSSVGSQRWVHPESSLAFSVPAE